LLEQGRCENRSRSHRRRVDAALQSGAADSSGIFTFSPDAGRSRHGMLATDVIDMASSLLPEMFTLFRQFVGLMSALESRHQSH
jgi:hypothetical protein